MFKALLRTQGGVLQVLGATWVVAFGIMAILLVRVLTRDASALTVGSIELIGGTVGAFSAILSVTLGLLVAVGTWSPDAQGKHVYALSLPVSRGQYVLLRLGIGGLVIVGCIALQWLMLAILGAWVAPPAPLRSYAGLVAARSFVVSLVAFLGVSWAWQVAGMPWARRVGPRAKLALVVFAIGLLIGVLTLDHPVAATVRDMLVADWSPVRLFLANWSLFDA